MTHFPIKYIYIYIYQASDMLHVELLMKISKLEDCIVFVDYMTKDRCLLPCVWTFQSVKKVLKVKRLATYSFDMNVVNQLISLKSSLNIL